MRGELSEAVVREVQGWVDVDVNPHRFGGEEFRWGRVEIGHVHFHGFVDIPLPVKMRDRIVEAGLANPHHILPESGWITLPLNSEGDVQGAIALLQLSFDLKRARRTRDPEMERRLEDTLLTLGLQT